KDDRKQGGASCHPRHPVICQVRRAAGPTGRRRFRTAEIGVRFPGGPLSASPTPRSRVGLPGSGAWAMELEARRVSEGGPAREQGATTGGRKAANPPALEAGDRGFDPHSPECRSGVRNQKAEVRGQKAEGRRREEGG